MRGHGTRCAIGDAEAMPAGAGVLQESDNTVKSALLQQLTLKRQFRGMGRRLRALGLGTDQLLTGFDEVHAVYGESNRLAIVFDKETWIKDLEIDALPVGPVFGNALVVHV